MSVVSIRQHVVIVLVLFSTGRAEAQGDPVEVRTFLPANVEAVDQFGYCVTISEDFIMIGAPEDETAAGVETGTVRIYKRQGNQWIEGQTLQGERQWDHFGTSIVIDGERALISAPDYDITGVNQIGAVYVYEWEGGQWVEQRRITPDVVWHNYQFGISMALSGADALIGAGAGRAHIYRNSGALWNHVIMLDSEVDLDDFGNCVALEGDTAIVGAPRDSENGPEAGAVYCYTKTTGVWEFEDKLIESGSFQSHFGWDLDMEDEDVLVVGAPGENSLRGGAYVFRQSGGEWVKENRLVPAQNMAEERFGASVAIDGVLAAVGAHDDDANPDFQGTATLFRFTGGSWLEQEPVLAPDEGESQEHFGWSIDVAGEKVIVGVSWQADLGDDPSAAYLFDAQTGERATVDSFTIKKGNLTAGDVSRLRKSDNKRLSVESEFTTGGDPPYVMILDVRLTSEVNNPSIMHVIVEGKLDQDDGKTKLYVYDWGLDKWKRIKTYSLGRSEKSKMVLDLDADLYVNDAGEIKVRIRQEKVTSSNGDPFVSSTDQVEVLVR